MGLVRFKNKRFRGNMEDNLQVQIILTEKKKRRKKNRL